MAKHFVLALVHKDGDTYGISFPDYPGVISGGDSFDEAVNRGANTLVFHFQGLVDDGEIVPMPTTPENAVVSAHAELTAGAMPALIEIEFPGRSQRINISVEEGLLKQIDNAAKAAGETRSGWLASSARARLLAG